MQIKFHGESGFWKIVVDGVVQGTIEGRDCYVVCEETHEDGRAKVVARFKYGRISDAKRWLKAALARYRSMGALYDALQVVNPDSSIGNTYAPTELVPMPLPRRTARKTADHVRKQKSWADRVARHSAGLEASVHYGLETVCQFYATGPIEVLADALKVGDLEISWESVQSIWSHHSVKVGW